MTANDGLIAGDNEAGKLCTICQSAIISGEQIVLCPDCGMPFHTECWEENRGCSQYGCNSAPQTEKHDPGPEMQSGGWGGQKQCPSCGETIKGKALKCRYCGAVFSSRDVMSRAEYTSREYEGRDYLAARNKSVALFLASGTGCLSPIALILTAVFIFGGSFAGMDFKRLPSSLRVLVWCSFGLNCFLTFLLVCFSLFDSA